MSVIPDKIYETNGRPRVCRALGTSGAWLMYDPACPDDGVCFYGRWRDAVNEAVRRGN